MRLASIITGLAVLLCVWMGPLPRMAAHSFAAHMAMHMGVVAIAAGFLGVGLAGSRLDLARSMPRLVSPIPASLLELFVVWAWHAPALHHFARHSGLGLVFEQGTFLASGYLVWVSAFGGERPRSQARCASGVIGLLLTSMHMTLLGALLGLSPRALYSHQQTGTLSPLEDQHLGGAIMLLVGGISYLLGGLWLTVDLLRSSRLRWEVGR